MKNYLDKDSIEFVTGGARDSETIRDRIMYLIERKSAVALQDMIGRPSIALSSGALGRIDCPRF